MTAIVSKLLSELATALETGAAERCGVVSADGKLIEIENIHAEPAKGFHMEPETFLAQIQAGARATWHTHPGHDPNLSEEDYTGFLAWPELEHHIVGIRDGKPAVHSFRVVDGIVVNA